MTAPDPVARSSRRRTLFRVSATRPNGSNGPHFRRHYEQWPAVLHQVERWRAKGADVVVEVAHTRVTWLPVDLRGSAGVPDSAGTATLPPATDSLGSIPRPPSAPPDCPPCWHRSGRKSQVVTVDLVERVARKLEATVVGRVPRQELRRRLNGRQRPHLAAALDLALERGWLVEETVTSDRTGRVLARYYSLGPTPVPSLRDPMERLVGRRVEH